MFCLFILFFSLSLTFTRCQLSGNLIINGGFELGDTGDDIFGWSPTADPSNTADAVRWVMNVQGDYFRPVRSGSRVLETGSDGGYFGIAQTINVAAGFNYGLEFFIAPAEYISDSVRVYAQFEGQPVRNLIVEISQIDGPADPLRDSWRR